MLNDDAVLKLLEAANWDNIIVQLTRYAAWHASWYKARTGDPGQLPGGMTPQDIAKDAIKKVWSRTRSWDPEKYPDLLIHLQWIVDSDLNHLFNSKEHLTTNRINESEEEKEESKELTYNNLMQSSSSPLNENIHYKTPEERLIIQEVNEREEKIKKELYALVKGDEDLELLLSCFEDGIDKSELIAKEMGWDVTKVYNLKRKLSRKAAAIIKIMEQE
jgi:hypothetical protein